MSNAQFYIAVGLPTFTIVVGFLLQHGQIAGLAQRMATFENRLQVMESDLRQFYRDLRRHDKAIEVLESGRGKA